MNESRFSSKAVVAKLYVTMNGVQQQILRRKLEPEGGRVQLERVVTKLRHADTDQPLSVDDATLTRVQYMDVEGERVQVDDDEDFDTAWGWLPNDTKPPKFFLSFTTKSSAVDSSSSSSSSSSTTTTTIKSTGEDALPVHKKIKCNGCTTIPIRGSRFMCRNCNDYDLCSKCYTNASDFHPNHVFVELKTPPKGTINNKTLKGIYVINGQRWNIDGNARMRCDAKEHSKWVVDIIM